MSDYPPQMEWPCLPEGVRSRTISVRDLAMHVLEAGDPAAPLILLLHGFPELSYSWRDVLLPLSQLGYHVVAPDQRGFGRTGPPRVRYEDDRAPYRLINLAHDIIMLVFALGHTSAASIIGHDMGSTVAGCCAIARPDLFRTLVLMSTPLPGVPSPMASAAPGGTHPAVGLADALTQLDPPKEHYMRYFCSARADADMAYPGDPEGLRAFLRAYFHMKSADWEGNDPHPLPVPGRPEDLARSLPPYYIMPHGVGMPDAVRAGAPSAEEIREKGSRWMPEEVLGVYVSEFGRTGFQGGLNRYRTMIEEMCGRDWGMSMFVGKKVEMPAMFLAGRKDWGPHQSPGSLERLPKEVCLNMADEDVVLVEGAGHWVQQERPEEVVKNISRFLKKQI